MLKRFNILILFCIVCICGTAQMTFTLNGIAYDEVAERNSKGLYIPTSDESAYGSNISDIAYNNATQANKLKKDPLSAIMMKAAGRTDGKVQHFSGHYHRFSDRTYTSTVNSSNKVHDYTVAAPGNTEQSNNAYIVLFKRGEGVKEVVQAQF